MTLHQLPLEVLENVINFLSVKDLIACCTVCLNWRTVFNSDIFWKKRCNKAVTKYLGKTEPHFKPPYEESPQKTPLVPICGWRLNFAREQSLWNNWRKGQFKQDVIEFELDDSISYNVKVECGANDFVFLHTTYETQVWDVSQAPINVMTIPFCLNEMWENNLYKFQDNKLIVVQCNVVQVYNVCLKDKTSTLEFAFFFDRPEEFSSSISKETNINKLFTETSYSIDEDVECIICGDFFVGVVTESSQLKYPKIHVWNWLKGKKIIEKDFSVSANPNEEITDVTLKVSETTNDEILVITAKNKRQIKSDFEIYNLAQQVFTKKFKLDPGDGILYGNYLLHWSIFNINAYDTRNSSDVQIPLYIVEENLTTWRGCKDVLMIAHGKTIDFFGTTDRSMRKFETALNLDYTLSSFNIVGEKFLFLFDMEYYAREVWELSIDPKAQNKEVQMKKIISFSDDIGVFTSANEVLTKVVFEKANKLIVLNFW